MHEVLWYSHKLLTIKGKTLKIYDITAYNFLQVHGMYLWRRGSELTHLQSKL